MTACKTDTEGYRCELVTEFSRLEAIATDWERLWAQSPNRSIFTTFRWIRACWQSSGAYRGLYTPLAFRDGRLLAILPCLIDEENSVRFIGHRHSDYNDILAEATDSTRAVELALQELLKSSSPWRRCVLENVSETSVLFRELPRLPALIQSRIVSTVTSVCSKLIMAPDRSSDSKSIIKKAKPHQNKLEKLGTLVHRHLLDRSEIEAHIPRFFDYYLARRAIAGDTNRASHEKKLEFIKRVIGELDPSRELRFAVLELSGRPIAYSFGFEDEHAYIYYKVAFDIDFWDYSVGQVLQKKNLEYAISRGVDEFDFALGDENYKNRFSNHAVPNYSLSLFRSKAPRLAYQAGLELKRMVKKNDRVFRAVQELRRSSSSAIRTFRASLVRVGFFSTIGKTCEKIASKIVYGRDEVIVYSCDSPRTPPESAHGGTSPGDLSIERGTLSSLARLAADFPEEIGEPRLRRAREKIKQGQRLYVVRKGECLAGFAWLKVQSRFDAPEVGTGLAVAFEQPEIIISDGWTAPSYRGQGIYRWVLQQLCERETGDHLRVWIGASRTNLPSCRAIVRAGFQARYRMIRTRFLNSFERSWIVSLPPGDR